MPSKYTADAQLGGTESIEGVEATEKQQESLDCSQVDCYSIMEIPAMPVNFGPQGDPQSAVTGK